MDAGKEAAANLTASAKAGMEKTKATTDEKVYIYIYIYMVMELMKAKDPVQKEVATKKKEARITQANVEEKAAHARNAATKVAGNVASALPGHDAGH
ncbi:hypothetical protein FH972_020175 [Carpinus fangiana]|uniref:Uncharacterized protein n=1 Tax=Carpinus fangiana TaxID=176857 RepID=A0A5N6RSD4_9ROSI|nr:hypothetical protein FH972_020175 [Carpinus fangiana]